MASNGDEYQAMQQVREVKKEKFEIDYNEQCSSSGSMAEDNLDKLIQELSYDELDQSIEIVKQLQKVLVNADGSEEVGECSEIQPALTQEEESGIVLNEPEKPLSEELRYDKIDLTIAIFKQIQKSFGKSVETTKQRESSQRDQGIKEDKKCESALTDSRKCLEEQKYPSQDCSGKYNDSKIRSKEEKHLDQLSSNLISNTISHLPDLLPSDIENRPIPCIYKNIDGIISSSIEQENKDKILNVSLDERSLDNSKPSKGISKPSRVEETVGCRSCPDESPKCGCLKRQMRIHPSNRPFTCKICGANFTESCNFKVHVRIHTGERHLDCKSCGSKFTRVSSLKRHMRIHTGERSFECKSCGAKFTQSSHYKRHMRIHKAERPFGCESCKANFKSSSHLKAHIRIHTGERPCVCKSCGAKFNYSSHYKRHMRIHTGERPFGCRRCGAKFTQSSTLKTHMRIHTDERPVDCNGCAAKFTRSSDLKIHMRIHTGERPFDCKRCGAKFAQSSTLKRHMRIHTDENPFECKICGAKFAQSGHLKIHIKIHTGERPVKCKTFGASITSSALEGQ